MRIKFNKLQNIKSGNLKISFNEGKLFNRYSIDDNLKSNGIELKDDQRFDHIIIKGDSKTIKNLDVLKEFNISNSLFLLVEDNYQMGGKESPKAYIKENRLKKEYFDEEYPDMPPIPRYINASYINDTWIKDKFGIEDFNINDFTIYIPDRSYDNNLEVIASDINENLYLYYWPFNSYLIYHNENGNKFIYFNNADESQLEAKDFCTTKITFMNKVIFESKNLLWICDFRRWLDNQLNLSEDDRFYDFNLVVNDYSSNGTQNYKIEANHVPYMDHYTYIIPNGISIDISNKVEHTFYYNTNDTDERFSIEWSKSDPKIPESPIKPFAKFLGWYQDWNRTIPLNLGDIDEDSEIYAKWEYFDVTRRFIYNGNKSLFIDITKKSNETISSKEIGTLLSQKYPKLSPTTSYIYNDTYYDFKSTDDIIGDFKIKNISDIYIRFYYKNNIILTKTITAYNSFTITDDIIKEIYTAISSKNLPLYVWEKIDIEKETFSNIDKDITYNIAVSDTEIDVLYDENDIFTKKYIEDYEIPKKLVKSDVFYKSARVNGYSDNITYKFLIDDKEVSFPFTLDTYKSNKNSIFIKFSNITFNYNYIYICKLKSYYKKVNFDIINNNIYDNIDTLLKDNIDEYTNYPSDAIYTQLLTSNNNRVDETLNLKNLTLPRLNIPNTVNLPQIFPYKLYVYAKLPSYDPNIYVYNKDFFGRDVSYSDKILIKETDDDTHNYSVVLEHPIIAEAHTNAQLKSSLNITNSTVYNNTSAQESINQIPFKADFFNYKDYESPSTYSITVSGTTNLAGGYGLLKDHKEEFFNTKLYNRDGTLLNNKNKQVLYDTLSDRASSDIVVYTEQLNKDSDDSRPILINAFFSGSSYLDEDIIDTTNIYINYYGIKDLSIENKCLLKFPPFYTKKLSVHYSWDYVNTLSLRKTDTNSSVTSLGAICTLKSDIIRGLSEIQKNYFSNILGISNIIYTINSGTSSKVLLSNLRLKTLPCSAQFIDNFYNACPTNVGTFEFSGYYSLSNKTNSSTAEFNWSCVYDYQSFRLVLDRNSNSKFLKIPIYSSFEHDAYYRIVNYHLFCYIYDRSSGAFGQYRVSMEKNNGRIILKNTYEGQVTTIPNSSNGTANPNELSAIYFYTEGTNRAVEQPDRLDMELYEYNYYLYKYIKLSQEQIIMIYDNINYPSEVLYKEQDENAKENTDFGDIIMNFITNNTDSCEVDSKSKVYMFGNAIKSLQVQNSPVIYVDMTYDEFMRNVKIEYTSGIDQLNVLFNNGDAIIFKN